MFSETVNRYVILKCLAKNAFIEIISLINNLFYLFVEFNF